MILYVALTGPPLLFGSREPSTIAAWCAILGMGLILASTRPLQRGHLLLLGGIAIIVLGFGLVLHEQLSNRPWIASFNPIWARASNALGEQLVPSVSIVKGQPFFALGHPLANILALILGLIVGVDSERARKGVRVFAWAAVGYAAYGFLALAIDPGHILWREKTAYIGNLTATFINRNTAATYFGSGAVVWLVLLMGSIRRSLPRGAIVWKQVPRRLLRSTPRDVLVRFVMLFVCLSALFMTGSRGGVLISLGVLMMTFLIYFGRDIPRGAGFIAALAGCLVVSLLMLQILGGNVGYRIDVHGLSDAGRLSVYRSTLNIIADNPWFGTGLGTFPLAFPPYRSSDISMSGVWDIGHSTPLELASEMGIPLSLIVAAGWLIALMVLGTGLRRQRSMTVPLAALAVSLIALVHSSFDFSLQIAGYSICVFALLGLGLSQAVRSRRRGHKVRPIDLPGRTGKFVEKPAG